MRTNMFDKAALRMAREIEADRLADECHGYDIDGNPVGEKTKGIVGLFACDSEVIDDLEQFLADNDFDDDTLEQMRSLKVGESMYLGGGAAPLVTFGREG